MARFTQSAILYQQMRGRGTRLAPHIHKSGFTMFDFVGVTDFHGDDDETIPGDITGRPQPTTGPVTPRHLLTLDVNDHIDPASRDWVTLDADGRIIRTDEHEARAAELGLRFEAWLATQDFNAEQDRWARRIASKIKADAATEDGFWDYDLDDPRVGGHERALRVFGGQEGLDLMLGSLNIAVFGDGGAEAQHENGDRPTT